MPNQADALAEAQALMAEARRQLTRLQDIDPYLIDLSLRENPVGSGIGQTLQDKLRILPQLREFGMRNIHLGSLDYALPDEPEVDDDFMAWLRDHQVDMTGCFAFTDIGRVDGNGVFQPSPSQRKLQAYTVPNTLHEIYLSDAGMLSAYGAGYGIAELERDLRASIAWTAANIVGDHGGAPRILINVVDGCDAFAENLERSCGMLALLAGQAAIEGVSIEDDRGSYFPFQVGTYVAIARRFLDRGVPGPDDVPVLGRNAYRLTLSFFRQTAGRFMDLAPERIGGRYGYRVCPVVSDAPVIAGRLAEVTGAPAGDFAPDVLERMIRLMRRELRAGLRIPYDRPEELVALYERARKGSLA